MWGAEPKMKSIPSVLAALAIIASPILAAATTTGSALAQARGHWRRGDVLPSSILRGGPNVDYAAQRLRRPPEGYGWFASDGAFLLASLSTGLVLEVVDN